MVKTDSLIELFLKVMNQYAATEKRPCDYGVGCLLYRSEIHAVEAIGKHRDINITALAHLPGITKSAASQIAGWLVRKGLAVKTVLSKSDTEVALTLTEKGKPEIS